MLKWPFKKKEKKKKGINLKYLFTRFVLFLFMPFMVIVLFYRFFFKNKRRL